MNKNILKKLIFYVGFTLFVCGCATKPGPNLASKAALIRPQQTTKAEVLHFLGPPVQIFTFPDGKEEWYYYYRVRNFWENVPVVKNYKGEDYTEVLKITIKGEEIIDCTYYTVSSPKKK
uniref:Lipoprotein SmpA/OmlA domain-containing protein n=1 Tax=Thermodesulfobacterium geofontis TaxID=1295609 RepID=A0A7V5XH92_9BACT